MVQMQFISSDVGIPFLETINDSTQLLRAGSSSIGSAVSFLFAYLLCSASEPVLTAKASVLTLFRCEEGHLHRASPVGFALPPLSTLSPVD